MDDRSSTSKSAIPSQTPSNSDIKSPTTSRPSYSSKVSDPRTRSSEAAASTLNTARPQQPPPPQQKAWTSNKNPITGRAQTPQTTNFNSQNKPAVNSALREPKRPSHRLTTPTRVQSNPQLTRVSRLQGQRVAQKKLPNPVELNGSNRKDPQSMMSFQRKDLTEAVVLPGNTGKAEGKAPNGNRSSFRTDKAISNSRFGGERPLQRWDGGSAGEALEDTFEQSGSQKPWNQFEENEKRFGLTTNYNEEDYTTSIDRNHPEYKKKALLADALARQIESGATLTSHHAEERIVDNVGGDTRDEEDSGVRRQQDFPPLTSRENKYTPPARRAPTAHTTVKGAPVDPAIISAQIKGAPSQKPAAKEESKAPAPANKPSAKPALESKPAEPKPAEIKVETKPVESKAPESKPETKPAEVKPVPSTGLTARPAATTSRTAGTTAVPRAAPNATETVTDDVLNAFRKFSRVEKQNTEKIRSVKAKQDKEVKLAELKKFANSFKLRTAVPQDLVTIIARDPQKQKEILERSLREAAEADKEKALAAQKASAAAAKEKEAAAPKELQAKPVTEQTPVPPTTSAVDARSTSRPAAPQHTSSGGMPNRHPGGRSSYNQYNNHNQYAGRNNNRPPQHMGGNPQTGTLGPRLRNIEQQKMQHHMGHAPVQDMRLPPTGPANGADPSFGRRISGVPPSYMALGPKLNPNVSDFRPAGHPGFAPQFNPAGPSQGSSPRSSVNPVPEAPPAVVPAPGQLIRRKAKSVDAGKCAVLSNIEKIQPAPGRNWDDNGGLRPAYDTHPAWRPFDDEKESPDSTMHLSYVQYLEKLPLTNAIATPNPAHALPQNAHQYQLPFHLQQGSANLAPRNSPHMPHMLMHGGHHGAPVPQVPYSAPDEHRMMHSTSAQSFASPRMGQLPMAAYPAMNAPMQVPYNQQVMQPYMTTGAPPMGYRSYSNNPQFMPQQPQHMGHMMGQPPYMPPGAMVATQPQVMYPGAHQQFIPTGGVPPQPMTVSNGFPSPGRPAAPMMAHQGSHQGQPVYGMSPGMPYQQPAYPPQQAAQTKFPNQRPQ
ncbi:hypothetical protein V8F33_010085 [Rhypophila sp. PSN 637]